ncbi:MAG TPA: hypothetical protein PLA68_12075, partial [Panacibacter sp.]|nr:hypothetical protein [Panacibacter sp.]
MLFCTASFSQIKDSGTGVTSYADSALQSYNAITAKLLNAITSQYNKLTITIQTQSNKLLERMQVKEIRLQKKIQDIDSSKAKELFTQAQAKYKELGEKLKLPADKSIAQPLKEYIPSIDSLQTALKFLTQLNGKVPEIPTDKLQELQEISSQLRELQSKLQQANDIQSFIKEREVQLKLALENTGLGKELLSINKEIFYYQQQITGYKAMLH